MSLINIKEPNHTKLWWLFGFLLFIKSIILAFIMFPYEYPANLHLFRYVPLYIPFILFIMTFTFLFNGKKGYLYQLVVSILISLLLLADALYFKGFGAPVSIYNFAQYSSTEDLSSSIIALIEPIHLLFIIDLPILVYYVVSKDIRDDRNFKLFSILATIFLVPILAYLFTFNIRGLPSYAVVQASPIGYHVYEFKQVLNDRNYELTQSDIDQIKNWIRRNNEIINSEKSENFGSLRNKNLIAIQFESLESFVIGNIIDGNEITPFLNSLLENSYYFPNVFTQVGDGGSGDAEFIVNTSIYPLRRGSVFYRFPKNEYKSLPNLLTKEGYENNVIHADNPTFWNRHMAFPHLGFKTYISEDDMVMDEIIRMGLSDRSLFRQSADYISNINGIFYSYIITLTSHVPFTIPENDRYVEFSENIDQGLEWYYQSMNYVDKTIEEFVERLKSEGILENSVIVIFGDHDGYHRYYDKTEDPMDTRIPLIIYNSEIEGKSYDVYGGQIDIFPTIADLIGIPTEEYSEWIMGKNLFNAEEGFAVLRNGEMVGSNEYQEHHLQGPEVADLIIRGNYFGKKLSGQMEFN